jgi:spore coat protein U-like protein
MPPSHRSSGARTGDAPAGDPLTRPLKIFAVLAAMTMQSQFAEAQKVRVTNLSDVDFGLIANLQAESRRSQNICVFSNSTGTAYSVSASGSGAGGSFSLSNGPAMLAYDVEWSNSSGQTSGTQLSPTVPLTGQSSSATHQFCNSGPASSASMTIVLRGAELSRAQEGSYSGTLTVLIAAE